MTEGVRIHPTAVVDPGATLGERVVVGPHCVVGPDVEIGDGCRLESQVSVQGPCSIGPDNVFSPMCSVGSPPQDLKYRGEPTELVVGARNRVREFVTLNRGTVGGGGCTRIGDDNLMMTGTHVAHDCVVGSRIVFANAATLAGHVEVGDDAIIGAFSGVHQFCRVAKHAFIGGYSVVTRDALPWVVTVGNRAETHGINIVGMRRAGYGKPVIAAIKACYKTLFRSKLGLDEAIERVEREHGHLEQVRYFIDFVRSSERGVVR